MSGNAVLTENVVPFAIAVISLFFKTLTTRLTNSKSDAVPRSVVVLSPFLDFFSFVTPLYVC